MATTADIRNGLCINFNGKQVQVIEFQHVKPGKGAAFVRTRLKDLKTGRILENTFNSGMKIDIIRIENREYQFLYKEGTIYHLMHTDTFEQTFVEEHLINSPQFLKEGDIVEVLFNADLGEMLSVELKPYTILEITYTEPGIKGDTATNTLKAATVETGAEIRVPLFINNGDKVKIDTRTGDYSERVKA